MSAEWLVFTITAIVIPAILLVTAAYRFVRAVLGRTGSSQAKAVKRETAATFQFYAALGRLLEEGRIPKLGAHPGGVSFNIYDSIRQGRREIEKQPVELPITAGQERPRLGISGEGKTARPAQEKGSFADASQGSSWFWEEVGKILRKANF